MIEIMSNKHIDTKGETLWNTFLDKDKAMHLLEKLLEEGWLTKECYMKCLRCIEERNEKRDASINSLGFSSGVYRCLSYSNIETIGQLRYILMGHVHPKTFFDFWDIRNVGIKKGVEIMQIAIEKGVLTKEEVGVFHNKRNGNKWKICKEMIL